MKSLKALLLFTLLGLLPPLQAQDIHFSMFDMAPLSLNPAYTGAFYGTYRIGGIYRDQWASFLPGQFTTPFIYLDAPVLVVRKRDWLGVGGMLLSDRAGTPTLSRTAFLFSAAYHMALDKRGNNVLTLGVQGGPVMWDFDKAGYCANLPEGEYCYGNEIPDRLGGGGDQDPLVGHFPNGPNNRGLQYTDINAGLLFKSRVNKEMDFTLGVGVLHLGNSDKIVYSSNKAFRVPFRINAHAQMNMTLTDKIVVTPQLLYTRMGPASEAVLQAWGSYAWDVQKQLNLRAGLGYRFGDAAEVLLGLDYKDFRVGVSYDVNVSSLKEATRFRGGFEAALSYIGKIYKKPKVKPAVICPKF